MSPTTNTNGPARKSLAGQIDRLDGILDGLAEGLQEAVATAVGQAVGDAVRQAVREAVAEILANAELQRHLRRADGDAAPATPARDACRSAGGLAAAAVMA